MKTSRFALFAALAATAARIKAAIMADLRITGRTAPLACARFSTTWR